MAKLVTEIIRGSLKLNYDAENFLLKQFFFNITYTLFVSLMISNRFMKFLECSYESLYCDGGCIEPSFICDGWEDCSDGSDEKSCPGIVTFIGF